MGPGRWETVAMMVVCTKAGVLGNYNTERQVLTSLSKMILDPRSFFFIGDRMPY